MTNFEKIVKAILHDDCSIEHSKKGFCIIDCETDYCKNFETGDIYFETLEEFNKQYDIVKL